MKFTYQIRILCYFFLFFFFAAMGCVDSKTGGSKADQTGQRTLIAYVDAEEVFLVSVNQRISDYLAFKRTESTILYQPDPDEILRIEYFSLRSAIKATGMSQPGVKIERPKVLERSEEIAMEKGKEMAIKLKDGSSFEDITKEYKLVDSANLTRIIKGKNPGYEQAIWEAKLGEITGPVVYNDRIIIFKVVERGVNDRGEDWADIYQISFLFPRDEAQKQLEDELAKEWKIKFVNKYYSALNNFYQNNLSDAKSDILESINKGDFKNGFSHYLLFKIYLNEIDIFDINDYEMVNNLKSAMESAVENCSDPKILPWFYYKYAEFLESINQTDKALVQFRMSLDNIKNDLVLTEKLIEKFKYFEDDEYLKKASEKYSSLLQIQKSESAAQETKEDSPAADEEEEASESNY